MTKKLSIIFFIIWLAVLFIGKNYLRDYQQNLINQEPIIRSYIDRCVLDFPFSFCRLVYNKFSVALPERILSFLDPLSVENVLLKSPSSMPLILFPSYLIGLFALFYRFKKYYLLILLLATSLLIKLVLSKNFLFYNFCLPAIIILGTWELFKNIAARLWIKTV